MKLLTKELEKKFPALYSTEGTPTDDKIVVAKFFHPRSDWTWYAIEYDENDKLFWGLVEGFEDEFGYSLLKNWKRMVLNVMCSSHQKNLLISGGKK